MSTSRQNLGFPYTDDVLAPNTSGLHPITAVGRPVAQDLGEPQGITSWPIKRGTIIPGTIGNTDYLEANTVAHGVLAGDS